MCIVLYYIFLILTTVVYRFCSSPVSAEIVIMVVAYTPIPLWCRSPLHVIVATSCQYRFTGLVIKKRLPMVHRQSWKPCAKRKAVFLFYPNAVSICTSNFTWNEYRGPPMTTKTTSCEAYIPH